MANNQIKIALALKTENIEVCVYNFCNVALRWDVCKKFMNAWVEYTTDQP